MQTSGEPDFDSMPAGQEMDALVAERVLGKKTIRDEASGAYVFDDENRMPVLQYSTEKAAAMWVLDLVKRRRPNVSVYRSANFWHVDYELDGLMRNLGRGDTYALAVCRAALKTVPT